MKLSELITAIGASSAQEISSVEISRVASPEGADAESVVFVSDVKYLDSVLNCAAPAVLVKKGMSVPGKIAVECADPYLAYAKAARLFEDRTPVFGVGVHASAIVDATAIVDPTVSIGPGSVVGAHVRIGSGCEIGARVVIEPGVCIGSDCRIDSGAVVRHKAVIGNRVIIQSGTIIGSEGFANAMDKGTWVRIPCFGTVVIEDDVEIGANTTIDRGNFEPTRICQGARLDNLIQIAHNVVVGPSAAIAAQVGIAGSTTVGRNAILAGQAGITGHIEIGDGAFVAAQAGVSKDVPANAKITGTPARPFMEQRRIDAALSDLPQLRRDVMQLVKTESDT